MCSFGRLGHVNKTEPIDEQVPDETLVERFRRGDDTAFDELVVRHQGKVYAIAYRMTRNREDSLDIAQEVFVRAHRGIAKWKPIKGFQHWLYRIATNLTIDVIRKRKRRRAVIVEGEDFSMDRGSVAPATVRDPVRSLELEDIGTRLRAALDTLPDRQRAVMLLRYYEDLSIKEIASTLGCTEGTVKTHLFRGTGKLRSLFDGPADLDASAQQ